TITASSGTPDLLDDTPYTVIITKQGYYSLNVPPDEGKGQTRVVNGDGDPVGNANPGTAVTLTVRPNLGYGIGTVTCTKTGATPSPPETITLTDTNNDGVWEYPFTTASEGLHYTFNVTYSTVAGVANVAYVSGQGRKTGAYVYHVNYDEGTATSWGTASNDLQAVINSWTGTNFTEIWVHGTVTPKTKANINGYQITSSDPKDKAFVIPPGLKIYGDFARTETGSKVSSGSDPRGTTVNNRLTVLSAAQDDDVSSHHVVIMADIPYTAPDSAPANTILDGLTISGGVGAGSPGAITVKGYSIDKQSGAGIYLVNASPVLNNVRIQGNIARLNGGGIYNRAAGGGTSSPRLTDTMFYNNTVSGNGSGGGMYNLADGANSKCEPELSGVLFDTNNATVYGGGMYNEATYTDLTMCAPVSGGGTIFRGNGASQGGGVYNGSYSSPRFNNVSIESNTAGNYGGGLYQSSHAKQVLIENTTIAGNIANGYGGGISVATNGRLELVNVTIAGNQSSGGGGIYGSRAIITMSNIIIKDNYSRNSGGGVFLENYASTSEDRVAAFIGNGLITGNRANSGNGGGVNVTNYTTNGSRVVSYLALTNVLIAGNHASGYGGGISHHNTTPITGSAAGYGVRSRLTNVTIAENTVGSGNSGGGGLFNTTQSGDNHIEVKVYNSVIWGNKKSGAVNNVQDGDATHAGRTTYYNSLVQGLTPHSSSTPINGASNGYKIINNPRSGNDNFNPSDWSASPLDSAYKLGSDAGALINGGDGDNTTSPVPDTSYRYFESKTSGSGETLATDVTAILKEATDGNFAWGNMDNPNTNSAYRDKSASPSTSYLGNIKKMAGRMVNRLSSDAVAAQGDLTHTVTVHGTVGPGMTVTVTNANTTPATHTRILGGTIDAGAYEKQ
ncbi:MAG: hypothetical protein LBP27_07660, partial [Treponema sp.]|nr:hypothetical protein [Treponema sp.]